MCAKQVNFYPDKSSVSIGKKLYTLEQLEAKPKSQEEIEILHSLKEIILLKNINFVEVKYKEVKAKSYTGMMGNGSST